MPPDSFAGRFFARVPPFSLDKPQDIIYNNTNEYLLKHGDYGGGL